MLTLAGKFVEQHREVLVLASSAAVRVFTADGDIRIPLMGTYFRIVHLRRFGPACRPAS